MLDWFIHSEQSRCFVFIFSPPFPPSLFVVTARVDYQADGSQSNKLLISWYMEEKNLEYAQRIAIYRTSRVPSTLFYPF